MKGGAQGFLLLVSLAGLMGTSGCGRSSNGADGGGRAILVVTQAPSDAVCMRVTVTGTRQVVELFSLMPGQTAMFTLNGLPTGTDQFSGEVFPVACSAIVSGAVPSWVSDSASTAISIGVVAQVELSFHHNGLATITAVFDDDASTDGPTATDAAAEAGGGTTGGAGGTSGTSGAAGEAGTGGGEIGGAQGAGGNGMDAGAGGITGAAGGGRGGSAGTAGNTGGSRGGVAGRPGASGGGVGGGAIGGAGAGGRPGGTGGTSGAFGGGQTGSAGASGRQLGSSDGGTADADGGSSAPGGPNGCANVQGSCNEPSEGICSDVYTTQADGLLQAQTSCTDVGFTWSSEACDRTGSVGGCEFVSTVGCQVDWFYPPASGLSTASDAQQYCLEKGSGQTFVSP